MKTAIYLLLLCSFINAQSLTVSSLEVVKGGNKTYFNPLVEKESLFGVYQIRDKESQKLFVFSLKDKSFNREILLKKSNMGGFGVSDDNEVFLAPFIGPDVNEGFSLDDDDFASGSGASQDAILACTFINENGKYQIGNYKVTGNTNKARLSSTTNPYLMINYPYLVQYPGTSDYLSLASSDKNILYSLKATAFNDMEQLIKPPLGAQDIGPVLSPDLRYIAFTRIYSSENRSSVFLVGIDIKGRKIKIQEVKEIGFGPGIHCQSPSFSPDSKKIAYYTNKDTKTEMYSIYVHKINQKKDLKELKIAKKALRKTLVNRGPTWLGNDIILFVRHSQDEKYPICYANLKGTETKLGLETTGNKDISVWREGGVYNLIFTSIGKLTDYKMIYKKIYTAKVKRN